MPHPLVTQLRFTRAEWVRGLKSVTPDEAGRRFATINPISWMIGHLEVVTKAADPYLDTLKGSLLTRKWKRGAARRRAPSSIGGFGKSAYRPER